MNKIIFDPAKCRQLIVPILAKPRTVRSLEVDRENSSCSQNYFRLLATVTGIQGPMVLNDSITSYDLPPRAPLCVNPSASLFLKRYLEDSGYRDKFVYNAIDAALKSFHVIIDPLDESDVDENHLEAITTLEVLQKLAFCFLVYDKNNAQSFFSYTAPVELQRMMTADELTALWAKCSHEETWYDRGPIAF